MNPLISIIVPVYNAEATLNRCVDSIINQKFSDWELLLINDGSRDRSGEICDEYAVRDSRIKVLHKENGGVSSARNWGLDNSCGKFIMFVDSDDFLVIYDFNKNIIEGTEDLILFSYYSNSGKENKLISPINSCVISTEKDLREFYSNFLHEGFFKTIWSKIFKRDLIGNLRFDENMLLGEDHLFLLKYLSVIKSLRFISSPLYIYQPPESLEKKYQMEVSKSIYALMSLLAAYNSLKVENRYLECDLFCGYKSFCQKKIYENPSLWYENTNIRKIYKKVKSHLEYCYRIKYKLMSISIFSRLRVIFKS